MKKSASTNPLSRDGSATKTPRRVFAFQFALPLISTALCALAAHAQPSSDEYPLNTPNPVSTSLAISTLVQESSLQWYHFHISAPITDVDNRYLDLFTRSLRSPSLTDTVIALYDGEGNLLAFDDDGGEGTQSALTFGTGLPLRTNPYVERTLDGTDGPLTPGDYYIALGAFPLQLGPSNFETFPTQGSIAGYVQLFMNLGTRVSLNASWANATRTNNCGIGSTLFTAQPFTGLNNTAVHSVTIDLSPLGNDPFQPLFDDGTRGDAIANDGIFSLLTTINAGTPSGFVPLTYRVHSAPLQWVTGPLFIRIDQCAPGSTVLEQSDSGNLPETAFIPGGSGQLAAFAGTLEPSDVDMFLIRICDPTIFSASTVGGTTIDTQLFLFDLAGRGVVMNDDDPDGGSQSIITSTYIPLDPGDYYLAISEFNFDPRDIDSQRIWNDAPFDVERTPDAPGDPGPVALWANPIPTSGGEYAIILNGTCFPEASNPCGNCPSDFDQSGGIDGGDIEAFFISWTQGETCADVNFDGGIDGVDVEYFFARWETGEC